MARPKNSLDTIQITISTTAQVRDVLERLTSTCLYGKNAADTAQALLKERIRELMEKQQVPS